MVWSVKMKRSSDWSSVLPLPCKWGGSSGGGRSPQGRKSKGVFVSAVSTAETPHIFCFHLVRIFMEVLTLLSKFS